MYDTRDLNKACEVGIVMISMVVMFLPSCRMHGSTSFST
jgi:hypothetical protein